MPDQLIFIFSAERMRELLEQNPDKIVIGSYLEEGRLESGERVGYLKVYAEARRDGEPDPIHTIDGCPKPPCDY